MRHVPVVQMNPVRGAELSRSFVHEFGSALERTGFATVEGHGVDPRIIAQAYRSMEEVFRHPDTVLSLYETPENGRQTGFASFKTEHAKNSTVPDLKRFWHVRDDPNPDSVQNLWPKEVPGFRCSMLSLFDQLFLLAHDLLGALDLYLGYHPDTLAGALGRPDTLLRALHYPSVGKNEEGVRSEAHEDINLITLLVAATQSGLEVKTRDGAWVPVAETPGSIVVNVGDMLQVYTGGRLVSTSHRVINPADADGAERYSVPFFVHPRSEVVLDPATGLTAGAFLRRRLIEIGLLKE